MKKKTITVSEKDLSYTQEKSVLDELPERYKRRKNHAIVENDLSVIRYLQKVKGATVHETASDLKINYKTMRDVYRRLEDAGIVKFITKRLPARVGNKHFDQMVFSLTPKFIKVPI